MVKPSRRKVVLGPGNVLATVLATMLATSLGGGLLLRAPGLHAEPRAATGATEDPTAARAHFKTGSTYYDLGKYDDAIREFEAAYEAKSDPAFLFNLAQAHRLADHPAEALHFYRTYLRYVPDPPNLADIEAKMKALERLAAARPAPPDSTPSASQTTTEPPPAIAAGPSSESSAHEPTFAPEAATPPPGGPPVAAPPVLPPDGASAPTAAGPAPPPTRAPAPSDQPPVSAPSVSASASPSVAPLGGDESATDQSSTSRRRLGKVLTIVGGSVMVAGALFGIGARVESNKVESATVFDPSVEKRGQSFESLQWVGYILGAVTAGVGVYLLVSPRRPGATPVVLVPEAGPHSGGATLRVSFR
jgi:hypothetical protein